MSLMRAVEKFDYARGNKFSTYASWAIMKNYARSIPEQHYHGLRYVTGQDQVLEVAPEEAAPAVHASDRERVRELIATESPTLHAWQVRLYRAGEPNETTVSFTPSGRPWQFAETLSDQAPGASLEPEQARALALRAFALGPFGSSLEGWEEFKSDHMAR